MQDNQVEGGSTSSADSVNTMHSHHYLGDKWLNARIAGGRAVIKSGTGRHTSLCVGVINQEVEAAGTRRLAFTCQMET